jgi:hypothetical protein
MLPIKLVEVPNECLVESYPIVILSELVLRGKL